MVLLIFVAGLGTAWMAKGYDVNQCKIDVSREKKKRQEELTQKRLVEMQKKLEAQQSTSGSSKSVKKSAPGTDHYGSIFAPTNLTNSAPTNMARWHRFVVIFCVLYPNIPSRGHF